jgi:uncharacterized protein YjiS (DUF1127 family)
LQNTKAPRKRASKERKGFTMFVTLILKRINAWRRYRANLRELGQLTDRELEDIGLSRSNLDHAARMGAGF